MIGKIIEHDCPERQKLAEGKYVANPQWVDFHRAVKKEGKWVWQERPTGGPARDIRILEDNKCPACGNDLD
jgi:hypothetical protein